MFNRTLVMFSFEKSEILSMDVSRLEFALKELEQSGMPFHQSFTIMFDGYNHVPDEIYEIEDIRRFVKKLFNQIPSLLYYITHKMDNHVVLLACIGDIEVFWHGEETLSADEYHSKGINPYKDLPQKELRITLSKFTKDKLVRGIKKLEKRINDKEGIRNTLKLLNQSVRVT